MEEGSAILFASVISAVIGGGIAVWSAIVTRRVTERQLGRSVAYPRQADAIDEMLLLLFRLQTDNTLTDRDRDRLIVSAFWLPPEVRDACLQLLHQGFDGKAVSTAQKQLLLLVEELIGVEDD